MTPWLESPSYAERMRYFSDFIGLDLVEHGTVSDADTIRDTAIAQPLIVAASMASFFELWDDPKSFIPTNFAVAGHSVGEFAAAAIANVLSPKTAIEWVNFRAQAMAKAAAATSGSMAAVLGGDPIEVTAAIEAAGATAANINGAGQIVAAGPTSAIQSLVANPPAGTRVVQLQVAGAFHSSQMQPAVAELTAQIDIDGGLVSDPTSALFTNFDGSVVSSGTEFCNLMVGQIANSVRWDLCMQAMMASGVTAVIELSPAGTLAGLAKRGMPGVEILALKTPDQIDAAKELIAKHI
jgi:[acyl-carrier-protein] S-malonyltransferase